MFPDMVQVGLPYLRAKAHDYFEALGGGVDHDLFDENEQRRRARSLGEEVRELFLTCHATV